MNKTITAPEVIDRKLQADFQVEQNYIDLVSPLAMIDEGGRRVGEVQAEQVVIHSSEYTIPSAADLASLASRAVFTVITQKPLRDSSPGCDIRSYMLALHDGEADEPSLEISLRSDILRNESSFSQLDSQGHTQQKDTTIVEGVVAELSELHQDGVLLLVERPKTGR